MTIVFLSYRRQIAQATVDRLKERLQAKYGRDQVFVDLDSIPPGETFKDVIDHHIEACEVCLAVIGPTWCSVTDAKKERRIDDPEDYVRYEIESAIAHRKLVIPVLVEGARMPLQESLPTSLRPLVGRNAVEVRFDPDFDKDIEYLTSAIDRRIQSMPEAEASQPWKRYAGSILSVAAAALAVLVAVSIDRGRDQPVGTAELPCNQPFPASPPENVIVPEMVCIEPGSFTMGSDEGAINNRPSHRVTIKYAFAISKYEITAEEHLNYFDQSVAPANFDMGRLARQPNRVITWHDAVSYTNWLGTKTGRRFRLPTEAEWEYAARAGETGKYPWGDKLSRQEDLANCADCRMESATRAMTVGQFPPNNFGLYDVIGNVSEWVLDCYRGSEGYASAPRDGSADEGGDCLERVVRGGSWKTTSEWATVWSRSKLRPSDSAEHIGFRIVEDFR